MTVTPAFPRLRAHTKVCAQTVNWVGAGLAVVYLRFLVIHRATADTFYTMVQDDAFYYIKIARSIASGHGSTFNGIAFTNGYHPLWMACLVIVSCGTHSLPQVIDWIYVVAGLSLGVTYCIVRVILRETAGGHWTPDILSCAVCLLNFDIFLRSGLEVVLTIPLAAALMYRLLHQRWEPWDVFLTSTLASVVVLSRLDSAIWIAAIVASILWYRRTHRDRHIWPACAGCFPLLIYLVWDEAQFGTWLPVSGTAKQLRSSHFPSAAILRSFHKLTIKGEVIVALGACAMVVLVMTWNQLPKNFQMVAIPTALFPVIHFMALSVLSDWPVWPWYFYSWALAGVIAIAVIARFAPINGRRIITACALLFCGAAAVQMVVVGTSTPRGRVLCAEYLNTFSLTHPGIYGMGDRAGIAGILLNDPVVQTEGLVMDETFVAHLRREDALVPTLRSYGVRYYVANFYGSTPTGCFTATEPSQGGPTAKHMRSRICSAPIGKFGDQGAEIEIFDLSTVR